MSKSLPNLEDLLGTVPSNLLVSTEDELESKKDFEDIMFELKKIKFKFQKPRIQHIFVTSVNSIFSLKRACKSTLKMFMNSLSTSVNNVQYVSLVIKI